MGDDGRLFFTDIFGQSPFSTLNQVINLVKKLTPPLKLATALHFTPPSMQILSAFLLCGPRKKSHEDTENTKTFSTEFLLCVPLWLCGQPTAPNQEEISRRHEEHKNLFNTVPSLCAFVGTKGEPPGNT